MSAADQVGELAAVGQIVDDDDVVVAARDSSSRTRLLPMKPAPPVTTIMCGSAAGYRASSPTKRYVELQYGHFASPVASIGQVDLRMRVPQVHAGQRAVQRQVGARDLVDALRRSPRLKFSCTLP